MLIKIIKFIWEQKKLHKGKVILILTLLFISAGLSDVLLPYVIGKLVDTFPTVNPHMSSAQLVFIFGWLALAYILFRYFSTVCWIWMRKAFNHVEGHTLKDTENRIRQIMFGKSMDFFNQKFSGALTNKETKFTRAYERLYDEFTFNIWPTSWRFLGVIILLLFVSPIFSLVFVVYGILYFAFMVKYSQYKFPYDEKASRKTSRMTGRIADIYTNILSIKLSASEKFEQRTFERQNYKRFEARIYAWRLGNIRDNIVSLFNDTAMVVIMIGAILSWNNATLTTGEVVLLLTYSGQIRMYMHNFGNAIKSTMVNYSDMTELMKYMDKKPKIEDPVDPEPCRISEGRIEINSISFSYKKKGIKVFEDFSLTIPAGQKVALVGDSGSGKSTLVKLIPRLHDISKGDILIDGQSIKNITQHDLRRNISMITQEPMLPHRKIKQIIKNDREEATMREIKQAAELACADGFISRELEHGYDTIVGERGVMLSGGQKQRVALACVLLEKTPILFLDEATSAIDAINEREIQLSLENLLHDKKRTMIVIAHRLSTVMRMDRVIVLKSGKIVEDGTPAELLEKKGEFFNLWRAQQSVEMTEYLLQLLTEKELVEVLAKVYPTQKVMDVQALIE